MIKKLIFGALAAIVVLLLGAVLVVGLSLDGIVRRAIVTYGPQFTKVDVKLDSVSLSPLSGSGTLKGFVLGNPQGFKTPSAIQVGTASLSVQPRSVFGQKVVIRSFSLQAPEITFETDLRQNNLSKILANVEQATGTTGATQQKPTETKTGPGKKLEVDDFLISGGKVHVAATIPALGERSATVPLPEIHLTDLGTNADGITGAELTQKVLRIIEQEAAKAASVAIEEIRKNPAALTGALGTNTSSTINQATKGLNDLLKKK